MQTHQPRRHPHHQTTPRTALPTYRISQNRQTQNFHLGTPTHPLEDRTPKLRTIVRGGKGRLRQGVESAIERKRSNLRDEIDAKSEDSLQAISALSHKRAIPAQNTEKSIFGQHARLLPKSIKFIPGDGLLQQRRHALPLGKSQKIQRRRNQVLPRLHTHSPPVPPRQKSHTQGPKTLKFSP